MIDGLLCQGAVISRATASPGCMGAWVVGGVGKRESSEMVMSPTSKHFSEPIDGVLLTDWGQGATRVFVFGPGSDPVP